MVFITKQPKLKDMNTCEQSAPSGRWRPTVSCTLRLALLHANCLTLVPDDVSGVKRNFHVLCLVEIFFIKRHFPKIMFWWRMSDILRNDTNHDRYIWSVTAASFIEQRKKKNRCVCVCMQHTERRVNVIFESDVLNAIRLLPNFHWGGGAFNWVDPLENSWQNDSKTSQNLNSEAPPHRLRPWELRSDQSRVCWRV